MPTIKIKLPEAFTTIVGKAKKRYAYYYVLNYFPEYDIASEQPGLYTENTMLLTLNVDKAKKIREDAEERRKLKKKGRKKK